MTQEFDAGIDAWLVQVEADLVAVARQSAWSLAFRVITDTPVDMGFLRGNWQPSFGEPAPPKANVALDPGGAMASADFAVTIAALKLGDILYYTNGCVYARRLEYGFVGEDSLGRFYNQSGRFYVLNNVSMWPQIVEETAMGLAA